METIDNVVDLPMWLINLLSDADKGDLSSEDSNASVTFEELSVPVGERNSKLIQLAGVLRSRGLGFNAIRESLSAINRGHFTEPTTEEEVQSVAKWISCKPITYSHDDKFDFIIEENQIAEKILKDKDIITSKYKNSHIYNGKYWEIITIGQLENFALNYDIVTERNRRSEIVSYIQTSTVEHQDIPWRNIEDYQIPFNNGVYDLQQDKLFEHSRDHFLEAILPYDFDNHAEAPLWLQCLNMWLDEDAEIIKALQEFFGYILMPHAKYKKSLFCFGPPDTGKSVVAQIGTIMVGPQNTCSILLENLNDPRAIAPIKGKMLNVITELSEDSKIAEGGFKKLVSTEDPVQIDAKYEKPELYKPFCKHLVCTNNLPKIQDLSEATYKRILLISFLITIPEEDQDRDLVNKLKREMPGIISWALEGAKRLYKARGHFHEPSSSKNAIKKYKLEQNPVRKWADEELCKSSEDTFILFDNLWSSFQSWLRGNRPDEMDMSRDKFSKCLANMGLKTNRDREGTVNPKTKLYGYRLKH